VAMAAEVRFENVFSREVLKFNPERLGEDSKSKSAPSEMMNNTVTTATPMFLFPWDDLSIQLYQPEKDSEKTLALFKACFAETVDEDFGVVEFPDTFLAIVDIPGFRYAHYITFICLVCLFVCLFFLMESIFTHRPALSPLVFEGEELIASILTYDAGDVCKC
jgi:hypothetical protein